MSDDLAALIDAADHAVEDVIAVIRQREMTAFHTLHDYEGHLWAGNIDQLQRARDILRRSAFITGQAT